MRKTLITCDFCGKEIENEIDMITLSSFRPFIPQNELYNIAGTLTGPEMIECDICPSCLEELQSQMKTIAEECKKKSGK